MGFGFKRPLVGEKRCVTTLITAAEETNKGESFKFVIFNNQSQKWVARWPHGYNSALDSGSSGPGSSPGLEQCVVFLGKALLSQCLSPPRCMNGYWRI